MLASERSFWLTPDRAALLHGQIWSICLAHDFPRHVLM